MRPFAISLFFSALLSSVVARPLQHRTAWFEDVTKKAGVQTPHTNRAFKNPYAHIMAGYTALGAAAAVGDFDSDGFDDILVTDSKIDGKNHLYHNNRNLTFTDIADQAGVADGNDAENASADALWFDFNNDGRQDLFVVRFGHSLLFENLGEAGFQEITRKAGLRRYLNAITAIAFDYDRDGFLDLFIGSYFQPINIFNPKTPRFFPESFESAANGGGITAYRNNHNGTFTDVTKSVGLASSGWVLDLGHGDADNDGDDDLYAAVDFGTDRFYVNNGKGSFIDSTETAIGIDTKKGMNSEWADWNGDLLLDIYVTNITNSVMREGNFLWQNNGNLTFRDVSQETRTFDTGWGWAGKALDYDLDGWLDLYVLNGWVSAGKDDYVTDIFEMLVRPKVDFADVRNWPPMGGKTFSGYERKRLFHNEAGLFFKEEAQVHGLDSLRDGRGIALADFDNDGRIDLFVTNANATPFLYRGTFPGDAAWAEFLLTGTISNRSAIGSQIRVTCGNRTYLRFVDGGNAFASQSTLRAHFGLAACRVMDRVEIRWTSGAKQVFEHLPAKRIYNIVENDSSVRTLH